MTPYFAGVPDLYYSNYNDAHRNFKQTRLNFDFDGSHNQQVPQAQQVPKEHRLHKVHPGRANAFNKLRDIEKNAKLNDMYNQLNFNSSDSSTGLLLKRPIYSEPRIQDGEIGHELHPSFENSSPKIAMKIIKEAVAEQNHQHTPSPPSNDNDNIDQDEKQGIKCTFEKPCAWTYEQNVTGSNFELKTGLELKEMNLTGLL